jgi:hypothetical protein
MITNDYAWVVFSSRQGVERPIRRKVTQIVEDIGVEETPLGDKFYFHYHVLDDIEWPYELEIRDDMSYGIVVKHQNDDDSGMWLNTLFYSLNEEDAKGYYEREFKRFEHTFYPHRYFKSKRTGVIFIESDYDGCMHYARIPGEPHTTRMWDNECIEVLDYEGTLPPKPLTGHRNTESIMCPECDTSTERPSWIDLSNDDKIYTHSCTNCNHIFEIAINVKVTYSTSINIDKFLGDKK